MRPNLFAISLLANMVLMVFVLLGWGLDKCGFPVLSYIVYGLLAAGFLWVLRLTKCPCCGWPLILEYRYRSNDCPRCGSTEDIKL